MPPQLTIDQAFQLAAQKHQAGRLPEAEAIYRQILQQAPSHANALHLLGVLASQTHRSAMAIDLIFRAINLAPNVGEYHSNLCEILRRAGQVDRAITHGQAAIRLKPDFAPARFNLAVALADKGQLDKAIAAYRRGIQLDLANADAHQSLGTLLRATGRTAEAIAPFQRAIELKASSSEEAYINLAAALIHEHHFDQAISVLHRALQIYPKSAEAHANLGNALTGKNQIPGAILAFRRAIEIKPSLVEAYRNLAVILTDNDQLDEAIGLLRRAIDISPEYANAFSGLAIALAQAGEHDQSLAAGRRAVELKPRDAALHSNLAYNVQFHPDFDSPAILAEAREWSRRHELPVASVRTNSFTNDRSPDRPLRIGYVGADFREHCQSLFTIPLFSNHDPTHFEIFCYANVSRPDATTERIRRHAHAWRSILGLNDQEAANQIRQDRIDILVDLTMHMGHNRLLVFARKPAPIQVAWLAFPGTTGLSAIDYRLTDPYLDPTPDFDAFYSEKSIRLPHSFWCYDPMAIQPIEELPVAPLPALQSGQVTFGCLNNFRKINDRVLELWSNVLSGNPESRLLLLAPPGSPRDRVLKQLNPRQVEFIERQDRTAYLKTYNRIDIGLDTIPANGHTTSLDSLWMGVPVVSLIGQTVLGRAGWSQLSNLNLRELAAKTPEEFVEIATSLATDLPRLSALRQALRDRMRQSPLMNAPAFARNVENAYRDMWKTWCSTPSINA
jgi:predicted O-linked N-acetylglucosamine transferase (SPINDLY family)